MIIFLDSRFSSWLTASKKEKTKLFPSPVNVIDLEKEYNFLANGCKNNNIFSTRPAVTGLLPSFIRESGDESSCTDEHQSTSSSPPSVSSTRPESTAPCINFTDDRASDCPLLETSHDDVPVIPALVPDRVLDPVPLPVLMPPPVEVEPHNLKLSTLETYADKSDVNLLKPLLNGWERVVSKRSIKGNQAFDVYYYGPHNPRYVVRSYPNLETYRKKILF